jgi:hypothetical protein
MPTLRFRLALSAALLLGGCDKGEETSGDGAKGADAKEGEDAAPKKKPAGKKTDEGAAEAKKVGSAAPATDKGGAADVQTLPEKVVEDAVAQADKEAGAAALFDPEDQTLRKQVCDYFTPQMVSAQFDVPASELKAMKVMGCIYTWGKDGQIVEAQVMMTRVHKTVDAAKTWFASATQSKTKEDIDKEFDQVKGKLDERKELDTKLKKNTAKGLTDIAKMGTPDAGVTYTDVPAIGDEARISSHDAALWVRLGNLTFQVLAYKGPEQPKPDYLKMKPKDIMKASMEAQKKWLADTFEQRKKDTIAIAPAVVEAFENR